MDVLNKKDTTHGENMGYVTYKKDWCPENGMEKLERKNPTVLKDLGKDRFRMIGKLLLIDNSAMDGPKPG